MELTIQLQAHYGTSIVNAIGKGSIFGVHTSRLKIGFPAYHIFYISYTHVWLKIIIIRAKF